MKKLFALAMALCLLLTAIPALALDQHEPTFYEDQMKLLVDNLQTWYEEKYGEGNLVKPFDETVTVHIVNYYTATLETNMATWKEWWGETLENNRYVDACKRALNIEIVYDWMKIDSDYDAQLRLEITANKIPDMFLVRKQDDLMQLAEAEVIMPVDEVIEKYFTTHQKGVINSDGGKMLEKATYDGKAYGIPRSISDTDTFSYLWLRKDWMEKLNLKAPKTFEDLKNIMKAFKEANLDGADKMYGLLMDKSLYYATRGIFAGFKAYPEFWVNDNETLVWGGTQETVKDALRWLHELYVEGYIDPEFITQTNSDASAVILNGQAGILYGGHWQNGTFQKMWDKDHTVDSMSVELPSADGTPVHQYLNTNQRGWLAINANYEHPEVAGMIAALCDFTFISGITNGTWWFSNDGAQNLEPFQASVSSWDNYNTYLNLLERFKTGDDSVLVAKGITYWSNLTTGTEASQWNWAHMFGDGPDTPMVVLGNAINDNRINYDAFLGAQSELMQDRWSTIKDEQLKMFIKIIIGEEDVDKGFASWLKTFDAMGGTQITEEVNDWYQNSKK